MKSPATRSSALAAVLVLINVVGLAWIHHDLTNVPAPIVRVLSALPASDADNADSLTLLFDREMVPQEDVGRIETAAVFTLAPAWPGSWTWSGRNRIDYVLGRRLPPGREFRVTPGPELAARTGLRLEGDKVFHFRTRALKLETSQLLAADDSDVTLELTFNQPVDPGELLRHLTPYDDKDSRKLPGALCLTRSPGEKLVVRTPRPQSDTLKLVLDGHLTGHEADLPLGAEITQTFELSRHFSLLGTRVLMRPLEEDSSIRLRLSRTLSTEQALPQVNVSPAVEDARVHVSEDDLVVSAKFKAGRSYTITVPGTLLADNGRTLGEDLSVTVDLKDRRPGLLFSPWQGVMSPHGNLTLDLKAVNVQGIEFSAWRLHENNLVAYLHERDQKATSRSILEKTIKLDLQPNEPQKVAVALRGLLGEPLGVYRIAAAATNECWIDDYAIVTVTDLAITAKRHRDGSLVWVTSLRTGQPVPSADVTALTYNNQTLASAQTDEYGIARLSFASNHPDGPLWIVTARKGDDLSFLQPDDNQWVIDDVDQSGRPHAKNYEVMLYPERGVYRPGDTIHITGIIRDDVGAVPPPFPLALSVIRPDGRKVADLVASPSEKGQGFFHVAFVTRTDGQTGRFHFRASLPGSQEVLGSAQALVEAFVPVRMEVAARTTSERFGPNDTPSANVTARYLWGQPAAGLPVSVDGTLQGVAFESTAYPGFRFGVYERSGSIPLPTITGKLDDRGRSDVAIALPKSLAAGLFRIDLAATVTEPGGRSVSGSACALLDTLDRHIGLRLPGGELLSANEPLSVEWVRLTGNGEPADPGDMTVRLVRVQYDTVLKKVNGNWVWRSHERVSDVEAGRAVSASGFKGSFQTTCPEAGMYRLTLTDEHTRSASQLEFYASDGAFGPQNVPMNRPERLEIALDRERYLPGHTAKVLVRSPLNGTLLLTLETDRILAWHVAQVTGNTAELDVALPGDLRGGAFLAGTVVRPVDPDEESWLPHRAMGLARVLVDHCAGRLPVTIAAPARAKPGSSVPVTVETGATLDPEHPTLVHVWAVDEGILLADAYRTPDPQHFFLAPRSPGVSTADLFYRLLPDHKRPTSMTRIGADGGEFDLDELRRNPVPAKRRQAAVVWHEAVPVGDDGQVTVTMELPDLITEVRLMAVAVDHDRYGQAEHSLTLTTPLIVEASWPRFVAPGDRFEVPVKLFNTTFRPLTVRAAPTCSGPIEISPHPDLARIEIPPGKTATCWLKAAATGVGAVNVRLEATELDGAENPLTAHSTAGFTVRPASPPHSEVATLAVPAGQDLTIPIPDSFLAGTVRMTVDVGARPTVHLGPALEDLIDYPYGCVEQTTSLLLSLLYAPEVLGAGRGEAIASMIRAGIARLWSMQTRSGGLGYWPGDPYPCEWGTAYAASCLVEAGNAGYEVDPQFAADLVKYLESRLPATDEDAPDVNTKALICRVMSAFAHPPHGWMARLAEEEERLDLAGRAHLACAYLAAGRRDRAAEILPHELPSVAVRTSSTGRLTSQVRQEGVWLSALLDIDPENPGVPLLAARLDKARCKGRWAGTLENAAAIAALARYQAITDADPADFRGAIEVPGHEPVRFDHAEPVSHTFARVTGPVVISSTGTGTVYLTVSSEGLAKDGLVKPYNRGLSVGRRWAGATGKPIDPASLRVGDLIRVEISLTCPDPAGPVGNIAVVDALPGGMEVENPRLATSARRGEPEGDTPDHVEFLDDRVVLFCSAGTGKQIFRYALRATAAGDFALPAIQASCMYDPGVASLGTPGRVTIQR